MAILKSGTIVEGSSGSILFRNTENGINILDTSNYDGTPVNSYNIKIGYIVDYINTAAVNAVLIGQEVSGIIEAIGIGSNISLGSNSIALGRRINVNGGYQLLIGNNIKNYSGHSQSIAIGANLEMNIGSADQPYMYQNNILIGSASKLLSTDNCIFIGHRGFKPSVNPPQIDVAGMYVKNSVAIGRNITMMAYGNNSANTIESSFIIGSDINISGSNVVFIGSLSKRSDMINPLISAENFIAIGSIYQNIMPSNNTIVIGHNAKACSSGMVVIGDSAESDSLNTVAIGVFANASGYNSISLGSRSRAAYPNAIAIGTNAKSDSNDAITIGYNAFANLATAANGIAIGKNSNVSGNDTIAIGVFANARGSNSIGIGRLAEPIGINSIAIGISTGTISRGSIAIGENAYTSTTNSIQLGSGSLSNPQYIFQVRNYPMLGVDGKIPSTRLPYRHAIFLKANGSSSNGRCLAFSIYMNTNGVLGTIQQLNVALNNYFSLVDRAGNEGIECHGYLNGETSPIVRFYYDSSAGYKVFTYNNTTAQTFSLLANAVVWDAVYENW